MNSSVLSQPATPRASAHSVPRAARWGLALGAILCSCSGPDRLLGSASQLAVDVPAPDAPFGSVTLVAELTDPNADQQDPTLRRDELEIYFTTTRNSQLDIWRSTRKAITDPWQAPAVVPELSTQYLDSNPELAPDGLTLYFVTDRTGEPHTHLWRAERPDWNSPWGNLAKNLNPTPGTEEVSPSIDSSGLWLAMAALRDSATFDIYISSRAAPTQPWSDPVSLQSLNSASDDWDPSLYFGATRIMFASRRNDGGDLFQAWRSSVNLPFSVPTEVRELNTTSSEGDPWVSADGRRVIFASKKTGAVHLYQASR